MPRLLHTADVHLGARHRNLAEAAVQQRERQFAAFRRAVDVALEERVELFIVAGDLFDSNAQPRRSVERAAAEFKRLGTQGIRSVVVPGTHDVYDAASIYRAHDLAALAAGRAGSPSLIVLTPEEPDIVYPELELAVHARVFATKRAPHSPLADFSVAGDDRARWHVGVLHGALRVEGHVEQDEVMFTEEEIAASGLDYLALGHWHSTRRGKAGSTIWAYSGAPEPVAVDQDGAGQVLVVQLEEVDGQRQVTVEARQIGQTRFQKLDLDASEVPTQQALVDRLRGLADSNLVLDVRVTGIAPDSLELNDDELDRELSGVFFRHRVRNVAVPPPLDGPLPPADTIAGAFVRDLDERASAAEAAGDVARAAELRDSLRLGRLLLADPDAVQLS
ncbi:MAG: DNA repair exonuclease [Chloroflexi bacterium]|nr:DNA repair exonuclease [Chloroflexota bacterium]